MSEVIQFDHGEGLKMQLRVLPLQRREQIGEVTEGQLRIQPAGDVQFGRAFVDCLSGHAQAVVDVVRIGVRLARGTKESAELAIDVTDIGRIEMPVNVEISGAPVPPAANRIGEFAQRIEVVGGKERDSICERKALAGLNLGADLVQFGVV